MKLPVKKIASFLAFLALVIFVGWVGQILTATSVGNWYQALQKPKWNPPDWVFAPVWSALYLTIAISGWLIYTKIKSSKGRTTAFLIYGMQLFFNVCWSYCFFFLKNPGLAFLDILILMVLIALNIFAFRKLYRPAAVLLIPYFLWTLYAAILNAAIWRLN